jgi:hypothetical protein
MKGAGGSSTGTADDPNQPLIDALNAAAAAAQALKDQLDGVKASIDAQTAFATSVSNTSNFQLTKGLADLISGHIVGYGVAGRAFTPAPALRSRTDAFRVLGPRRPALSSGAFTLLELTADPPRSGRTGSPPPTPRARRCSGSRCMRTARSR